LNSSWEGLLLIDKPSGPTSHAVVQQLRRLSGQRRIGHAGTLDPLATGLLPLVLGRATRLVRFLPHSPKTYVGSLQLGLTSDTDDVAGEVTRRHVGPLPAADEVLRRAAELLGRSKQAPPRVSARKVGGQRLYRLARRGIRVDAPEREIEVLRFDLTGTGADGCFSFVAEVTAGTYIRALARDLGERLGCGGVLSELRRTRIGPMDLRQAVGIEGVDQIDPESLAARVIPAERMPLELPGLELDAESGRQFCLGRAVSEAAGHVTDGPCRVVGVTGALLGIGESLGGRVHPRVVLGSDDTS
jgi:tRNA pseudouridine55 synthase